MAEYLIKGGVFSGSGQVLLNGDPITFTSIEEGTLVTLEAIFDPGFVSVEWYNGNTLLSTANPYAFNMPARDISLRAYILGTYAPIDGYGLKYTYNKTNINGDSFVLTIEEDGYGGLSEERELENITFYWNQRGSDIVKDFLVPSKIDIDLVANNTNKDYSEFLTGDNRKFRAKLYLNGAVTPFFTGYISPNQIRYPSTDTDYQLSVTALDGISTFGYIRSNPFLWPSRDPASKSLSGVLNETFAEFRELSIACSVWETRMNQTITPFTQFWIADNCLYEDGDQLKYAGSGNPFVNQFNFIDDVLNKMLNIFVGRLFLWNNRFYFTRYGDYLKPNITYTNFNTSGDLVDTTTLGNDFTFDCINGTAGPDSRPEIVKSIAYNEFTASLKFGVLQPSTGTAKVDYPFSIENWFLTSIVSTPPNTYKLLRWDYIKAVAAGQPSSPYTGDTARVQFVSEGDKTGCKIWTTTTTSGVSDPNLSWIELSSTDYGTGLSIVQESANTFTLEYKFMVIPVGSSSAANGYLTHNQGLQVQVGSNYLYQIDATTFGWTTTPTIIQFPVQNKDVFNTVSISEVVVPETAALEVRLYQLILNSGTKDKFAIIYKDFKINIDKNEALAKNEISVKGQTDVGWNLVYDTIETFQGDALTVESTSALRLNDPLATPPYPVSEAWTRDGVESIELLQYIVQEVANVKGRQPQRQIIGVVPNLPDPTRAVQFDGSIWIVTYAELDVYLGRWTIELTEIG